MDNFKKAIKIIQKLLNENKIKWALVGSTNMQLQGMNVNAHDLDLVVQLKDLEKIQKIFSGYNPSNVNELPPMTSEPAWDVKFKIDDINIHILGERDTGEYVSKLLKNRIIHKKIDDVSIPCFTLEAEAQTYSETHREHKAELIKNFLKNDNPPTP